MSEQYLNKAGVELLVQFLTNMISTKAELTEVVSIEDLTEIQNILTNKADKDEVSSITRAELNTILYSGKNAVVSDIDAVKAMINNEEEEVTITLNKDLTVNSTLIVPEGKTITLNLEGNNLIAADNDIIPIYADGGKVILKNGTISATTNAIVVQNNGSLTIDNVEVSSSRSNAIAATNGEVTLNSGTITSQEAGIAGFKNSTITINGGTLEGLDNCPVMGNGSAAGSNNDGSNMNVVMNGGTLIAHIESQGYAACGVYVPNSGSFTMNGGEIISDGAGIVVRGG